MTTKKCKFCGKHVETPCEEKNIECENYDGENRGLLEGTSGTDRFYEHPRPKWLRLIEMFPPFF